MDKRSHAQKVLYRLTLWLTQQNFQLQFFSEPETDVPQGSDDIDKSRATSRQVLPKA
jgi:hypothetical protein